MFLFLYFYVDRRRISVEDEEEEFFPCRLFVHFQSSQGLSNKRKIHISSVVTAFVNMLQPAVALSLD